MKTTENNKLIAEFMDYQLEIVDGEFYATKDDMLECLCVEEELHYHTSWDWLIPVINKCYQERMSKHIAEAIITCDIDEAYKVVVGFIKAYNKYNNGE